MSTSTMIKNVLSAALISVSVSSYAQVTEEDILILDNKIDGVAQSASNDIDELSALVESRAQSMTSELNVMRDSINDTAAVVRVDVERITIKANANEQQIVDDYIELSGRIDDVDQAVSLPTNENLATRVFLDVNNTSGVCDQRVDTFNFTTEYSMYTQNIQWDSTSGGVCDSRTYYWDYGDGLTAHRYVFNNSGTSVDYGRGWQVLKDKMRVGETWGRYDTATVSAGGVPQSTSRAYHKHSLIDITDFSSPAGSFSNCLVIDDQLLFGENPYHYVFYFCEGPGLARLVDIGGGKDYQLQSYTEN